ncbi:MAG: hypothetical protein NFCOHLIN_03108 [Gammaproteobacteria bacterium]|nr:hypothetical protein [Gammaproteobacteria bacterium]
MGNETGRPLAADAAASSSRNSPDPIADITRLAAALSAEQRLEIVNRILAGLAEPPPAEPPAAPEAEVPVVRMREASGSLGLDEFPEVEATMDVPLPDGSGRIDLDRVVARYDRSIEETMLAWREGRE